MDGIERLGSDLMKGLQAQAFTGEDVAALARLSDAELAAWQSTQRAGGAAWLWAQQQWQLRLLARQGRQLRWATVIGGAMGIAGALLGSALTWWLGK